VIEKYLDAGELKRLLSGLMVVLGAILIGGLFAITVVPGLRNANRPEAPTPVSPVVGEPGWLDPAEFPPERGRVVPPVDPAALMAPSPELTGRGQDLFRQNCVPCHGDSGRGDGPAAATMSPRPRDLSGAAGWKNGYDLPGIFRTLTGGIPGTSMAPFDFLSKRDRMALAHHVQALGTFPHGEGSREAVEALSRDLAAAGEKTPNRIPVSLAMARLAREFGPPPPLLATEDDRRPGAEVLRRIVSDPARAALALAGSDAWRAGPADLSASILPGTPGNGFAVSTATLSPAEWQALQEELLALLPRGEREEEK
jgi:mono/diheme cytochrome c family protein